MSKMSVTRINLINEKTGKEITPSEYFDQVKERKKDITDTELDRVYENSLALANKYSITGQKTHLVKLVFLMQCIEKERELIKRGVTTYVEREDIEYFIENVADKVVKVIEMSEYPREIPDEIVESYVKVKDIFDKFYVVFTDYTGKEEKKVEAKKREKDPILFATFEDKKSRAVVNRFYYLGDWEDEYCDLTLEKMTSMMKSKTNKDIQHTAYTPKTLEELTVEATNVDMINGRLNWNMRSLDDSLTKKPGFFSKVKSVFGMK